jgi:hypothetical protein
MNLIQTLAYGIEIIEHVYIQKHYKLELSSSPQERKLVTDAPNTPEALFLCDFEETDDYFFDTPTTFDVYYKGHLVYKDIFIAELEDYINNLILIDQCKTLKVNQKRLKAYRNTKAV